MRILLAVLLLAAPAASAQGLTLTYPQNPEVVPVGADDCDAVRTFTWTYTGNTACEALKLWVTAGSCGAAAGADDQELPTVSLTTVQRSKTGTVDIPLDELPLFTTGATPPACGAANLEEDFKVCGHFRQLDSLTSQCSSTATEAESAFVLRYDTRAPEAPGISAVVPQDSALTVNFTPPQDAESVRVQFREAASVDAAWSDGPLVAASTHTSRVGGLTNGVAYRVRALALDEAGNLSAPSAEQQGTPVKTSGFFSRYQEAGGDETGGCGATGSGAASTGLVLGALGFWWFSRRMGSWVQR